MSMTNTESVSPHPAGDNATLTPSRSNSFKAMKWLIFGVCLATLAGGFLTAPASPLEDEIGYMLRVTARIAFIFLLLAYVATPLTRLFGLGRILVKNRRYLGLAMALAHTVHFGYVVAYVRVTAEPVGWIVLLGAGGAFVAMWLMALTSNDYSIRLLGKRWKTLHRIGLHYLWIIFMQTFVGVLVAETADPLLYGALVVAGLVGLLLRIAAFWRVRLRSRA